MRLSNKVLTCIVTSCVGVSVFAASSFVVQSIRVQGLQGIPVSTVLSYLPIKVGDTVTPSVSATILQNLYNSGLFENVNLSQEGNTLVISVSERSAVGAITITGNKKIKTADINTMMKNLQITVGSMLNRANIDQFKQQLLEQYSNMGRYNASVIVTTTPMSNSRSKVTVTINEGNVAKIRSIRIVGNQSYAERKLLKQFILTTPHLWSFFTHDDEYSRPKLDASLQNLESFYLNHGYLKFKVLSADASLTPDKSGVDIVVSIYEGPKYKFSGFNLSGNLILPRQQLNSLVGIRPGDVFSRQVIISADDALGVALGDQGYAFSQIEPIPSVDDQNRTVFINFFVNPGPKVYVRRITFSGNTITADSVMRHNIVQQEGSLVSVTKIRQSVRLLNLLGFFKNVQVKTTPVPGTNNQVDLDFDVIETPAGQASVNLGYGTLGLEYGAGINQPNFMGTGKTVGVNFSRSQYQTSYSFNYYNPYYTVNNIGRGFTLYYNETKPEALNLAPYTYNTVGGTYYYSIPISLYDRIQLGLGFNDISLKTSSSDPVSTEIQNFINEYGTHFDQFLLSAGWTHNGLDRAIYPTKGITQSLAGNVSVPASSRKLDYYTVTYGTQLFEPLSPGRSFVGELSGGAGYGNGYSSQNALPFFENFYAGGLSAGQVRGYETNDLGPRDNLGNYIGGNELVYGSAALIFPNYISDSLRTSIFVDAGNVYQSVKNQYTFGSGPVRYTSGLGVEWQSPLGPLSFSYAIPLNKQPGDQLEPFQFTMGTTF